MERVPIESLQYDNGRYHLDGKRFTGIAYIMDDSGDWVQGEIEIKEGVPNGPKREWWDPGKPMYEATWRGGVVHGKKREWHYDGQLKTEGEFEYGIAIWEKKWDEDGELIDDYRLKETDSNYKRLQEYRAQDKEIEAREKRKKPKS